MTGHATEDSGGPLAGGCIEGSVELLSASDDRAYFKADAADRRAALHEATLLIAGLGSGLDLRREWLDLAAVGYRFLRSRDSLRAVSVQLIPGTPHPEGQSMTATINLADTAEIPFSLTGLDAKGAQVPLPDGFTAAWTLTDPDNTGAVLTASADDTTATLSAGVPDTNLMVGVTVTFSNPDGSTATIQGAEAVIVTATEATTVGIVPGTPTPEA